MSEITCSRPNLKKSTKLISLIMILIVGVISNYIYVLSVYVSPLNETYGWSMNTIVLTYSMAMFFECPAFILGGILSNKFGMKRMLVVSGALYGLAILFSGMTKSVVLFIICQGVIGSLAMYGVFICTLALINTLYPKNKGLVMGILYGSQALGGAVMAPIATFFIDRFNVSMALVIQGVIFTVIMVVCCLLVADPTKGDKELQAKIQNEADMEEAAAAGINYNMSWKRVIRHPSFYLIFFSIILIQLIGNVLVTDIAYIAEANYEIDAAQAALTVSLFNIGAGAGGVVVGFVSDRIGPFRTTMLLGVIDGILLAIMAVIGSGSFIAFIVIATVQGFTYNGLTTLNPIMTTDAYGQKDLGINMGLIGVSIIIVGIAGPQFGLMLPFVPMLGICAVLSVAGGILAILASRSLNKYYKDKNISASIR